jgi:hypothetical protein
MKRRVSWAVLPAVVLAACGGDGGDAAPGGSVERWCAIADQVAELEAASPGPLDLDPAARESLDEYRSLLDEAAAVAPEEALGDANAMADGVDRFVRIAESVDYDFDRLGEDDLLAALDDVLALDEPIGRLRAFNARECGLELVADAPSPVDPSPTNPSPTTAPPTDPPVATDPSGEPAAADVRFAGDADSAWCAAADDLDDLSAGFAEIFFADPADIEEFMRDALERLDAAAAVAPPEIADAVATSIGGVRALDEAFAAAGYDPLDTDLAVIGELDPEIAAANDLIDEYNADVCGIVTTPDGDLDDLDFDPALGTVREQAIAEFVALGFTEDEARCIFDSLDFSDPAVLDDSAALAEVLTDCGIDFERLAELG